MRFSFEHNGSFIALQQHDGRTLRCFRGFIDVRKDETLDAFIRRHGGEERAAEYVRQSYYAVLGF